MNFNVEMITPELAKEYLKRNVVNRGLRKTSIRIWAGIMRRGNWDITHQGIAFNTNGELIDGQNRLNAIIKANVPVQMVVARDLPHNEYRELSVDQGNKRNYADQYQRKKQPAQTVTYLTLLSVAGNPANDQIDEYYHVFGSTAEKLVSFCPTQMKFFSSVPMRAGAVLQLMRHQSAEYVLTQYRALVLQDYDKMSKKIKAISKFYNTNQSRNNQEERNHRGNSVRGFNREEVLVRAYDGFDPTKQDEKTSIVKNKLRRVEEIKREINIIFTREKNRTKMGGINADYRNIKLF